MSFTVSHLGESYCVTVALSSCVEVDSFSNFLLKEKSLSFVKKKNYFVFKWEYTTYLS